MEPISHTVSASVPDSVYPRRTMRVATRGASSHFVGSTIVILSSYAVATLAMNCGKKIQEERLKPSENWCRVPHQMLLLFDKDVHLGETFFNKKFATISTWHCTKRSCPQGLGLINLWNFVVKFFTVILLNHEAKNRETDTIIYTYELVSSSQEYGPNQPKWGLGDQILQAFLLKCYSLFEFKDKVLF